MVLQVEMHFPDGVKEIVFPDSTRKIIKLDGMQVTNKLFFLVRGTANLTFY